MRPFKLYITRCYGFAVRFQKNSCRYRGTYPARFFFVRYSCTHNIKPTPLIRIINLSGFSTFSNNNLNKKYAADTSRSSKNHYRRGGVCFFFFFPALHDAAAAVVVSRWVRRTLRNTTASCVCVCV